MPSGTATPVLNVPARQRIAHELTLVRGAIALVATHGSRRVTVGGLLFGEQLLPQVRRLAQEDDVEIRALWNADESGCDICVEARDGSPGDRERQGETPPAGGVPRADDAPQAGEVRRAREVARAGGWHLTR